MKTSKSKLVNNTSNPIIGLRKALFLLKLERRAGRLLKTHQIKALRKEIARNLTKNQQKGGKT